MGKYAIFLVLALTFSMLTYSYALRNSIFISEHRTVQSFSYSQAHNIAQSAAMIAINGIRSGDITYPTTINEEWEDMKGEYSLNIYEDAPNDQVIVESTGIFYENKEYASGGGVEEVAYTIRIGLLSSATSSWNPNFDQAIHAEDKIDLTNGQPNVIGDVTLNSTESNSLLFGNQSDKIDGNLYIGPDGDPEEIIDDPSKHDGTLENLGEKLEYPMPIFPDFPSYSTTSSYPEDNYIGYSENTIHINNIDLKGNSTLTIDTGDVEDQELNIVTNSFNAGADVEVIGEGILNIYVQNELDLKSNVNLEGDPGQMWIYYHGDQDVELYDETLEVGGNTIYNGNLFADKANIRLRGGADIRGHILTGGNTVQISGDASVNSRVIYAPNATVEMDGRGSGVKVQGSIISKEFKGNGNYEVTYNGEMDIEFPDFQQEITGYPIAWWN